MAIPQSSIPAGLSLAMLLQDAAAQGEVTPTTREGRPTVFGDLANKVTQPPTTAGVSDAAGMSGVAGGIAATEDAEKKKKIDQLLASMSQGQDQGMMGMMPPQGQPQGQPQMMPGMAPGMARGGIAQFADGGAAVALPANISVPTIESAVASARDVVGLDPARLKALEEAEKAAAQGRQNMPLTRAYELEVLERIRKERDARQKQYEAEANQRKLAAFLQGVTAGGMGGGGATYWRQKEAERQQGLGALAEQENYAAKLSAIKDLQEAQMQGNRDKAVDAAGRLANLDMESKKGIAQLTGNLFQGNTQLYNAKLDYLASRQNATDNIRAERIRSAAGKVPTGDTMLIMKVYDSKIRELNLPPGQKPTPQQDIAAMDTAIKTVRPAVSSRADTAADTLEERRGVEFAKQLTEAMSKPAATMGKNRDPSVRAEYRKQIGREIGKSLGMTDADIDRRLGVEGAAPPPGDAAPTRIKFDAQGNPIK